jgi:hypothetical protein
MVVVTVLVQVSITDTDLLPELTTYAVCVDSSTTTSLGDDPTVMVAVTVFDRVSITDTRSSPLATYAVCAAPSTATPKGFMPTAMVAATVDATARASPVGDRNRAKAPPATISAPTTTAITTRRRVRPAAAGATPVVVGVVAGPTPGLFPVPEVSAGTAETIDGASGGGGPAAGSARAGVLPANAAFTAGSPICPSHCTNPG